jgi:hypothetical protein
MCCLSHKKMEKYSVSQSSQCLCNVDIVMVMFTGFRGSVTNVWSGIFHSLFRVALILEHRASLKRFVSLQFLNPKTIGRTLWMGDQPIARPTYTNRINANIHALSGIRIHDPFVRASEDSSCLRQRGRPL